MKIVLASASATRKILLERAGVDFICDPSDVDEAAIKKDFKGTTEALALKLSVEKAYAVCARHPGALVLGADQILDCAGQRFDKSPNKDSARQKLLLLRGRTHNLVTAQAVLRDGKILWEHVDTPRLKMRDFSNAFLDAYMENADAEILSCVGAYRIEDPALQLFEEIEGDYFSILGLHLLPLLEFLRTQGVLKQ